MSFSDSRQVRRGDRPTLPPIRDLFRGMSHPNLTTIVIHSQTHSQMSSLDYREPVYKLILFRSHV